MAKVKKILMLIENMPAPLDRRVWPEAIALRNHGFQVSIICPKGSTQYRESYICIENIHIYRYQLPETGDKYITFIVEYGIAMLMTFWLSLKVLLRPGFDVILAANPPNTCTINRLFYRLLDNSFSFGLQ